MHDVSATIEAVRQWGVVKGITGPGGKATLLTQLDKSQEELTETRDAAVLLAYLSEQEGASRSLPALYKTQEELKDGIGDCGVTLILAAELAGLSFEECLSHAYSTIRNRTGKMVNGQFVKDA